MLLLQFKMCFRPISQGDFPRLPFVHLSTCRRRRVPLEYLNRPPKRSPILSNLNEAARPQTFVTDAIGRKNLEASSLAYWLCGSKVKLGICGILLSDTMLQPFPQFISNKIGHTSPCLCGNITTLAHNATSRGGCPIVFDIQRHHENWQ